MKYFTKAASTAWEYYGKEKVLILGDRVLAITKTKNGKIEFREQCDDYFSEKYTKEEAVELLQEAIDWVNGVNYEN